MKKLLIIFLLIGIFSCKKEMSRPSASTVSYVGTYYSVGRDTVVVNAYSDTSIASLNWLSRSNGVGILFDSVRVLANGTITCNEYAYYCLNQRVIGSGTMGSNKLNFRFTLTNFNCGGDVVFNGIK